MEITTLDRPAAILQAYLHIAGLRHRAGRRKVHLDDGATAGVRTYESLVAVLKEFTER
ncbi:MAG: hypothetical protein ABSE56_24235 [Bryobacteraceae bacterium]